MIKRVIKKALVHTWHSHQYWYVTLAYILPFLQPLSNMMAHVITIRFAMIIMIVITIIVISVFIIISIIITIIIVVTVKDPVLVVCTLQMYESTPGTLENRFSSSANT